MSQASAKGQFITTCAKRDCIPDPGKEGEFISTGATEAKARIANGESHFQFSENIVVNSENIVVYSENIVVNSENIVVYSENIVVYSENIVVY